SDEAPRRSGGRRDFGLARRRRRWRRSRLRFRLRAGHFRVRRCHRPRRGVALAMPIGIHDPEIMFRVLIEVFRGDSIARRPSLARQGDIAFEDLVGVAPDFDARTIAVERLDPVRHPRTIVLVVVRMIAVVVPASVPLVLPWPHDTFEIAIRHYPRRFVIGAVHPQCHSASRPTPFTIGGDTGAFTGAEPVAPFSSLIHPRREDHAFQQVFLDTSIAQLGSGCARVKQRSIPPRSRLTPRVASPAPAMIAVTAAAWPAPTSNRATPDGRSNRRVSCAKTR